MKCSGIILAKNEAVMLRACLESIKSICDEIIVINNGSTDETEEIAKKAKAKVVTANEHDFSRLRNLGLKHAKHDWVFYIDADERVSEELADSIHSHVGKEDNVAAYKMTRKNFYLGENAWPQKEKFVRIFKKKHLKGWKGSLHETPEFEGEVVLLSGDLLHFTHRSLSQMVKKTIEWSEIEAKLRYDTHHPAVVWWRIPRVMVTAFFDSYIRQQGWKAGTVGVIESVYQAFSMFVTYARLWELQQSKQHAKSSHAK